MGLKSEHIVAGLSAMSGFLFGYDTGIISGALIFVRDEFNLNDLWQQSIVSSTLLTAWFFSLLTGPMADHFGRKPIIVLSSLVFVTGSILMAIAWDPAFLLVGRLVVGAAVGLASMTVPMYIAEVAPPNIRGKLVMINMCCITGGQLSATIIAYGFSFIEGGEGWRFMLGFAALPAAIQFFSFLSMPESPRWLISKDEYAKAKQVLVQLRSPGDDTEAEFKAIISHCVKVQEDEEDHIDSGPTTLQRILATQPVRKALLVGSLLMLAQQGSGINTVMYYTASIFEMSGVHSKQTALLLSCGTALVNFTFTLVGYALVERAGRRKLTLYSLFGVILSLIVLAAGFQFAYNNSPQVTQSLDSPLNAPCNQYSACSACSRNPECGFCFSPSDNSSLITSAMCLHVDAVYHDRSIVGNCTGGSASGHIWAYEWCPSAYSWVTIVGMVMYLFFFAPGMGPMPWTINSEIYPSWARSWCMSVMTSVCWLTNMTVAMTFLSLTSAITKHGVFYLYAGVASVCFIYFLFVLPETKGKTLEELESLFAKSDRTNQNEVKNDTMKKSPLFSKQFA